jgi:hypothetical protein
MRCLPLLLSCLALHCAVSLAAGVCRPCSRGLDSLALNAGETVSAGPPSTAGSSRHHHIWQGWRSNASGDVVCTPAAREEVRGGCFHAAASPPRGWATTLPAAAARLPPIGGQAWQAVGLAACVPGGPSQPPGALGQRCSPRHLKAVVEARSAPGPTNTHPCPLHAHSLSGQHLPPSLRASHALPAEQHPAPSPRPPAHRGAPRHAAPPAARRRWPRCAMTPTPPCAARMA